MNRTITKVDRDHFEVHLDGQLIGTVTRRPNQQGSDRLAGNSRFTGWAPSSGGIVCESLDAAADHLVKIHNNPPKTVEDWTVGPVIEGTWEELVELLKAEKAGQED